MSKQAIVISGGAIEDAFALEYLKEIQAEYLIGVDSGLHFLHRNEIKPTHIVGDFDSVEPSVIAYYKEQTDIPVRQFNPVKDATDTEIALRLAIELGVKKIWILGATGTRLDHVLSNIHILKIALDAGVETYLVDACNRISLWGTEIHLKREESFGKYFSLFPLDGVVTDVTIEGAKYPLFNDCVRAGESRCVSNEMEEDEVCITFASGTMILMETRDKK